MTRWAYRIVGLGAFNTSDRLPAVLGRLGSQGWELVGVYDKSSNWIAGLEKGFALFKRPIPDGEPEPEQWAVYEDHLGQTRSRPDLPTDGYIGA